MHLTVAHTGPFIKMHTDAMGAFPNNFSTQLNSFHAKWTEKGEDYFLTDRKRFININ
jgi:hypothetical protein